MHFSIEICKSCLVVVLEEVQKQIDSFFNNFLQVKETDLLPKQICRNCLDKLGLVCEMADTCIKAESRLCDMMANKQFRYVIIEP